MTRLPPLTEDELDESQRAFLDKLNAGPRGAAQGRIGLIGPYGVWARTPHVGEPTQLLGAALRFGTRLDENIKEVAICTVGAFHHAKFEFAAHRRLALRAGVNEAALDRLQAGEPPALEGDEAVAHAFTDELLRRHRPSQQTYDSALAVFGEPGLIELVTLIGYYVLVSYTLNSFEVDLLDGMVDPFPDY
ncbi:MAG: carboxymuconolactone decarboxylase family protein [Gammaproteobacteria bacterium]